MESRRARSRLWLRNGQRNPARVDRATRVRPSRTVPARRLRTNRVSVARAQRRSRGFAVAPRRARWVSAFGNCDVRNGRIADGRGGPGGLSVHLELRRGRPLCVQRRRSLGRNPLRARVSASRHRGGSVDARAARKASRERLDRVRRTSVCEHVAVRSSRYALGMRIGRSPARSTPGSFAIGRAIADADGAATRYRELQNHAPVCARHVRRRGRASSTRRRRPSTRRGNRPYTALPSFVHRPGLPLVLRQSGPGVRGGRQAPRRTRYVRRAHPAWSRALPLVHPTHSRVLTFTTRSSRSFAHRGSVRLGRSSGGANGSRHSDSPSGSLSFRLVGGGSRPRSPRARSRNLGGQNFPFEFFQSLRAGMVSIVSQCSTIFPCSTRKRS